MYLSHPSVLVEAAGVLLQVSLDFGIDGPGERALVAFSHDFVEEALADEACFSSLVLGT